MGIKSSKNDTTICLWHIKFRNSKLFEALYSMKQQKPIFFILFPEDQESVIKYSNRKIKEDTLSVKILVGRY